MEGELTPLSPSPELTAAPPDPAHPASEAVPEVAPLSAQLVNQPWSAPLIHPSRLPSTRDVTQVSLAGGLRAWAGGLWRQPGGGGCQSPCPSPTLGSWPIGQSLAPGWGGSVGSRAEAGHGWSPLDKGGRIFLPDRSPLRGVQGKALAVLPVAPAPEPGRLCQESPFASRASRWRRGLDWGPSSCTLPAGAGRGHGVPVSVASQVPRGSGAASGVRGFSR